MASCHCPDEVLVPRLLDKLKKREREDGKGGLLVL